MTIGERLKKYAKIRCGSVRQLAEEIGWTADNLGKYTSGRNEPGAKLLRQLIEHGCSATWLISGDGPMLVEDLRSDGTTETGEKMLRLLESSGIKDADALKSLLSGLRTILDVQESFRDTLGKIQAVSVARKQRKSGR